MILTGCSVDDTINELYVATTGDDRNPGTAKRPFRTIERARDEVRKMNDDRVSDITVYIQGGTYIQEDTLRFEQEDSATNGHMITYKAYNNEPVVISGGKALTGWKVFDEQKGIYKAEFGEKVDTRQIYVNGKRAVRARSKEGLSSVTLDPDVSVGAFGMSASNVDMAEWKNIDNIEFAFKSGWTNPKCGVKSIQLDPNNSNQILIEMKQPGWNNSRNKGHSSVKSGPVFIENAYELLDEPGEWYLDKTGSIGGEPYTFYYKPVYGEDMETVEVVVPILEELMIVESKNIDHPVSNIQFQGIAFKYATWLRPNGPDGHSDAQNNYIREVGKDDRATGGNIVVNGAKNVIFDSCEFSHMGNVGLYLKQGNKDNLVRGCHFYDISAQAIQIGDVDFSDPKNFYLPHPNKNLKPGDEGYYTQEDWDFRYLQSNNDILNNIIHDVAVEYYSAAAIGTGVVEETDISHNEIYNVPYSGLHIGYGWTTWEDMISPMGNNKIQYNYIHNVMQILNDGGAIYLIGMQKGASGPDGWERKSIISHNYLKDQHNQYGSIYLDEGANYYDIYKNVIDTTPTWLLNKHKQNDIHDNYSNQTNYNNHPSPWESGVAIIENTTYVQGNNFPKEAQEIINSAGIQ